MSKCETHTKWIPKSLEVKTQLVPKLPHPTTGSFPLGAPTVTVHIDPTETFTTVFITGERYTGIGTAKRNPRDKHKAQIGVDIALARALRELADNLEHGASL